MGECFFWYQPTRVVPDKWPLNGCCCRVVSYLFYFEESFFFMYAAEMTENIDDGSSGDLPVCSMLSLEYQQHKYVSKKKCTGSFESLA